MDTYLFSKLHNLVGQSGAVDALIVFFGAYVQYIAVGALIIWAFCFGRDQKKERIRIAFFAVVSALLARVGFTELIRFFYDRPRPFEVFGFTPLIPHEAGASFPSGHAAFFFGLAFAIALLRPRLSAWFFVAAALISLGRVIGSIHYPSDILGGVVVGFLSATLVHLVRLGYAKHLARE